MFYRHLALSVLAALLPAAALADNAPEQSAENNPLLSENPDPNWVDSSHQATRNKLQEWAHGMDGWFGEPDPDNPASANLRIMLDTEWDKYDGTHFKPRIRGKVRLPNLEKNVNVIFGDDSLDDHSDTSQLYNSARDDRRERRYDGSRTRDDNASLAVRWSEPFQRSGIETDLDLGVRSGSDLYVRAKARKDWDLGGGFDTYLEQVYRYGIKSEHHVRTNWEVRHRQPGAKTFEANHFHVQYEHDGGEEAWTWANSLYKQHEFFPHQWFNYGIHVSGDIKSKQMEVNSYGPFMGWRQPVWRKWLYAQAEVTYYNDKKADYDHRLGGLLRLEALF